MNVTRTNHDEVSALLTVTLNKSDYKDKVEKQLINYAKNATVPGFRKGKVPLSMVRKQFEAGIAFEEINKQISEALNNYVNENNLRLVGQPVPVPMNELDYNAEEVSVGFEVGFEPDFNIDLSSYEAPHYKVEATDKEINQSIENMQKRFAEMPKATNRTLTLNVHVDISSVPDSNEPGGSDVSSCAICWSEFGVITNRKQFCQISTRHVCNDCSTKRLFEGGREFRVSDGQYLFAKAQEGKKAVSHTMTQRVIASKKEPRESKNRVSLGLLSKSSTSVSANTKNEPSMKS